MQVTLRRFVKDFRSVVAQNAVQKSVQLGKGQCKDMEEYKKNVGWIAGLEAAGELAEQMLRQMEEATDDSGDGLPEMPPLTPPPGVQTP